ncbi:hypothetical protein MMC31_003457, partial [Peltigera leucophlebia]|nr:hypothetical protein [Peltigera leucophlebia]
VITTTTIATKARTIITMMTPLSNGQDDCGGRQPRCYNSHHRNDSDKGYDSHDGYNSFDGYDRQNGHNSHNSYDS